MRCELCLSARQPDPYPPRSVRSTNVYEEQSLGVFRDEESDFENEFQPEGSRMTVWSRYLAMHARKQLAFGPLFFLFVEQLN